MKKLNEVWFEYAGSRNTDKGVRLLAMPTRPVAAERGESIVVAGRSGALWVPDNSYENGTVSVQCMTDDTVDMSEVAEWLSGAGLLRFSDDSDRAYVARVIKRFTYMPKIQRFVNRAFAVTFDIEPFRYHYPEADDITITASGTTIENPGTMYARPRVTITGSGEVTLFIGLEQITIDALDGSIIIDSELEECFGADGLIPRYDGLTFEEYPTLAVGGTMISWDGNVTSVTVRPRWRDR